MRCGLSLLALGQLALASMFVGVIDLARADYADIWLLIQDSRFPRTIATILTGASLAIAGQIMQLIARNRFVEPMTAGTGQSAVFGVLVVAVFLPGAALGGKMALASGAALCGSLGFLSLSDVCRRRSHYWCRSLGCSMEGTHAMPARMPGLDLLLALCCGVYLTQGARGDWGFTLAFRGQKLVALLLVGVAMS